MNRLVESGSCSILKLSNGWAETMSFYRFLKNPKVTEQEILEKQQFALSNLCSGKELIVPLDTTDINCSSFNNRVKDGSIGKITKYVEGFLMHPLYCVDAKTKTPLGIAGLEMWTRDSDHSAANRRDKNLLSKESKKWYLEPLKAKNGCLKKAKHITYVMDREGDIYEVLSNINDERTDLVVRCRHNRRIVQESSHEPSNLRDVLKKTKVKGQVYVESKAKRGKVIKAFIKYKSVEIQEPKDYRKLEGTPSKTRLQVVQIATRGKEKVNWILLTTKEISNLKDALEIVDIYKMRWEIEELFRLMKTESFDIESSELADGKSIKKLALYVMEAAVKIQKLKIARDGSSTLKTEEIFSEEEIHCLQKLNKKYEGNTEKQQNPHNEENLAWASWIIARMGGWKGYASQRPPGPTTFQYGLEKFSQVFIGFNLLEN